MFSCNSILNLKILLLVMLIIAIIYDIIFKLLTSKNI